MPALYQTILCPTDLSPVSRPAVDLAYALARPGGVVHLLYVSEPLALVSPFDGTYLAYANDPAEQVAKEQKANAQMKRLVPDGVGNDVRTETTVIHDAGVATQILAEAKRIDADAIVMGTHGRSGFGRLLMGSVATELLRKSPVPLVLVHDRRAT